MTTKAAVAVIGGGVIGASIAYHLAREGVEDILIIDRAPGPGAGSTGRATGGFRAQFAAAVNVRLSLISREALQRFEEETGVDPGFQQVGYLWLASSADHLNALRAAQRTQRSEGLHEAREVSIHDIATINPLIDLDGIAGGVFCPTDGYIKPLEILRGYLEAAERLGVRFLWDAECTGMQVDGNRIQRVETTKGSVSVEHVVDAAGPWAARIAAMAEVRLPVYPLRRQAAFTVPCPAIPPDMPMTIWLDNGFHVRAREGRAMFAWPNAEEPGEPKELRADEWWIVEATQMAHQRVPILRDIAVDRSLCYAGLYEMSPDHQAILGTSPLCENLFFANGSSGHGVMHSPAIGSIIADMIVGRQPKIDVSSLRLSRFDEGNPVTVGELL